MTPVERAALAYREAKALDEAAYEETSGIVQRAPRTWLAVADAYRAAAEAARADGHEPSLVQAIEFRAAQLEELVSEAYAPEISPQLSALRTIARHTRRIRRRR